MAVKITGFTPRESQDGKQFIALTLQGGIEIVKSSNGSTYVTVRKVSMPTTFDAETAMSLLGSELPGSVEKVQCEPYDYTIQQTGETITLTHKYEYVESANSLDEGSSLLHQGSANSLVH